MNFPTYEGEFKRNAVEPIECIKGGWNLIRSQYWLFLGITLVGVIIGSIVPFGILLGPMMCGIYLALFKTRRGEPIEFGLLFKGFDYFGDAIIATLIHMAPIVVIVVPAYIVFYIGFVLTMVASQRNGGEPDPSALIGFFVLYAVFILAIVVIVTVLSVIFIFAYPLIVDRRLKGIEAVKLSIRAGLANFWRVLGLLLLLGLMTFAGVICCYVGAIFVMPITYAALAVAYEQVFGLGGGQPSGPPPPPSFV
jgi:hypothetical protein